jgi:hypothetical protein
MGSVTSGSSSRSAVGSSGDAMIVGSSAPVMTAMVCRWSQPGLVSSTSGGVLYVATVSGMAGPPEQGEVALTQGAGLARGLAPDWRRRADLRCRGGGRFTACARRARR